MLMTVENKFDRMLWASRSSVCAWLTGLARAVRGVAGTRPRNDGDPWSARNVLRGLLALAGSGGAEVDEVAAVRGVVRTCSGSSTLTR